LIALHGHTPDGLIAHLAVAILDSEQTEPCPYAAAIDVFPLPDQFGFTFVPWSDSPWADETYLGQMLGPEDARQNISCGKFFGIAERVVEDLAEVQDYFAGRCPKPKGYSRLLRRLLEINSWIRIKPEIWRRPTDGHRGS
jgi:hypothetical protein